MSHYNPTITKPRLEEAIFSFSKNTLYKKY